ncbi:dihydrofolate reductase family protein [Nocardia puris]|uniref:dihydrofolate reductase family protein n=1 Tax=Nocardia puris TaxID=208602 RepID=UPI002B4B915B|nr:hypothetical protein [Nocardia puris]
MTTVYYTAASLDGFLIGEDGSLDWLAGVESIEEDDGFFDGIGAMCMGANTYEWIRANEPPESWHEMHGDLPCWVFTHRDLPRFPGPICGSSPEMSRRSTAKCARPQGVARCGSAGAAIWRDSSPTRDRSTR